MTNTIRSGGHEALRAAIVATRLEAGLTQGALAARLRVHQSLLARIEGGERRVDAVELVVIARALEVPPSRLWDAVEAGTRPDHRL